jgi:hypothetical protein
LLFFPREYTLVKHFMPAEFSRRALAGTTEANRDPPLDADAFGELFSRIFAIGICEATFPSLRNGGKRIQRGWISSAGK